MNRLPRVVLTFSSALQSPRGAWALPLKFQFNRYGDRPRRGIFIKFPTCSWCRRLQNCKHEPRERLTVESLCQMLGRKRLGRTGPVDSWVAYPVWGPGTPAFVWLTGSRKCTGPGSLVVQTVKDPPAMQETQCRSLDRRLPWRREWPPTPLFLLGEFHGQRSLHPWGRKRVGHEWVTNTELGFDLPGFHPKSFPWGEWVWVSYEDVSRHTRYHELYVEWSVQARPSTGQSTWAQQPGIAVDTQVHPQCAMGSRVMCSRLSGHHTHLNKG